MCYPSAGLSQNASWIDTPVTHPLDLNIHEGIPLDSYVQGKFPLGFSASEKGTFHQIVTLFPSLCLTP